MKKLNLNSPESILLNSKYVNEEYCFLTNRFKISQGEFFSFYPYLKIPTKAITSIEITKGFKTKRPLLTLFFGLALLIISIFLFSINHYQLYSLVNGYVPSWGFVDALEIFGHSIWMFGFVFAIGIAAIFQVFLPSWIMRLHTPSGYLVFELQSFKREKKLQELILFLRYAYPKQILNIDQRLLNLLPQLKSSTANLK